MSEDRDPSEISQDATEATAPVEAASEGSAAGASPGGAASGDPGSPGAPGPSQSPELQEALDEALAAVGGSPGAESAPRPAPDANEKVTEALITAKKELEQVLEQTQKEAEQLRSKWMRAAADLENYRRRASKEREDVQKFGIEKLLKDFLPVIDDLDRAVGVVAGADTSETNEQLLGGVRLVQKKFLSTLEKHGVTSFVAKGEAFNPERHEAVQQAPSDVPAGAVAEELQRGFLLHDRLLRPALVVVSLGPPNGAASGES